MKKDNKNESSDSTNFEDRLIGTSHPAEKGASSQIAQPSSSDEEITAADEVQIDNMKLVVNGPDDNIVDDNEGGLLIEEDKIVEENDDKIVVKYNDDDDGVDIAEINLCLYGPPYPSVCEGCIDRDSCSGDFMSCPLHPTLDWDIQPIFEDD